jgi:hypothetical protein
MRTDRSLSSHPLFQIVLRAFLFPRARKITGQFLIPTRPEKLRANFPQIGAACSQWGLQSIPRE